VIFYHPIHLKTFSEADTLPLPMSLKHGKAKSRLAPLRALTELGQHAHPKPKTASTTLTFGDVPEFQQMREQVLQNADLSDYPTEKLENFYTYLRQYSLQKALEQSYDDAQSARDLSDRVLSEINSRSETAVNSSDLVDLAEREKSEFEERWGRELEECDAESRMRRQQLEERQSDERGKFENVWMVDMPRRYRKPSPQLLQLRKIEKSLAVSGNFQKAKKVHLEVEQLAQIEMANAQELLIRDYETAQRKLAQKQRQEAELFERTRLHLRSILIARYDAEKVAIDHRELVVQVRAQNPRKAKNSLVAPNPPTAYQARSRTGQEDVLLPPLRAPNDPGMVEEQNRRRKEEERRKLALQKKHAEEVLQKYTLDAEDGVLKQGLAAEARPLRGNRRRMLRVTEGGGIRVVDHLGGEVEASDAGEPSSEPSGEPSGESNGEPSSEPSGDAPLGRICHSFIDVQSA
jgi:hypothetical protein